MKITKINKYFLWMIFYSGGFTGAIAIKIGKENWIPAVCAFILVMIIGWTSFYFGWKAYAKQQELEEEDKYTIRDS